MYKNIRTVGCQSYSFRFFLFYIFLVKFISRATRFYTMRLFFHSLNFFIITTIIIIREGSLSLVYCRNCCCCFCFWIQHNTNEYGKLNSSIAMIPCDTSLWFYTYQKCKERIFLNFLVLKMTTNPCLILVIKI